MRFCLSCLLVITLVFRGLLGNAMAMGVIAPVMPVSHTAHAQHAEPEHTSAPTTSEHYTAHASATPHGADNPQHPATTLTTDHCAPSNAHGCGADSTHSSGACSACGICHSSAGLPPLMVVPLPSPCAQHIAAFAARFASAAPAALVKPPISAL